MIIKRIAIGNGKESYIEAELSDGFNVIFSDDNNKGKTIVIQSMLYALGNKPVFPSTFGYKNYYHIVEFEINGKNYLIARKKDTFILKEESRLNIFDNESELKNYWSKNIHPLPKIIKGGVEKVVDFELFNQLFFVAQDKKDSSNIANKGYYKKDDFISMIFSLGGIESEGLSEDELFEVKRNIKDLLEEKSLLEKEHKILKSKKAAVNYLSQNSDRLALEDKIKEIEKVNVLIGDQNITRNMRVNKKSQYLDCGSKNIGLLTALQNPYTFDISTKEMRDQILSSIDEKVKTYEEEIDKCTGEINVLQEKLKELISADEISLESVVRYKKEIIDTADIEEKLTQINEELKKNRLFLSTDVRVSNDLKKVQRDLINDILFVMNKAYKLIDPSGNLVFENLFTKVTENYSGSEFTEFMLVKMYAYAKVLNHSFPIIIDSFRAEELSTIKEDIVMQLFAELPNQKIFTTTIKEEEGEKYSSDSLLNSINYSQHTPNKILSKEYTEEFKKLANDLLIAID